MDRSPRSITPTRSRTPSQSPTQSPSQWAKASRSPSQEHRRITLSRSRSRSRTRSPRSGTRSRSRSRSQRRYRSRSPMSSRRRHVGTRDDPLPSHCLGVFGLSVYTSEKQLEEIFDKYGSIERVQVVLDAKTGKSRGFAFVYFDSVKSATNAKNDCSGMEIDGRRIRVDYSITQRAHTPTPGIYMGRPTTGRRGNYDRGYGNRSNYRDRYRSPSPRYRARTGSGRRDYYDRGYDRYDSRGGGYDRYEKYDRYERYDRYDRSRSRSFSPRRYKY